MVPFCLCWLSSHADVTNSDRHLAQTLNSPHNDALMEQLVEPAPNTQELVYRKLKANVKFIALATFTLSCLLSSRKRAAQRSCWSLQIN